MSNGHECRCAVAEPHETFGQCMRHKNVRVGYCQSVKGLDASREKRFEKSLHNYADARRQGIQPAGTSPTLVQQAVRVSNETGTAFQA